VITEDYSNIDCVGFTAALE